MAYGLMPPQYNARYPQNYGLAAGVNAIAAQNAAIAQRNASGLLPRYDASPGMNPSPAGQYANRVAGGGLMGNYGAQQNYRATGYMPNTTVGGNYGGPSVMDTANNRLSDRQVIDYAANRNQYAPMGAAGLGNPGGRFFGGAIPGQVSYGAAGIGSGPTQWTGGAGSRQGFLSPPPLPINQQGLADAQAGLRARGYIQNDQGSWMRSGSTGGGLLGNVGVPATGPYAAGPAQAAPMGLMGRVVHADERFGPDGRTYSTTPSGGQVYHDQSRITNTQQGYGQQMQGLMAGFPQQVMAGGLYAGGMRPTPRQIRDERKQNAYMDQMRPGLRQQLQMQGQYQQGLLGNQQAQIAQQGLLGQGRLDVQREGLASNERTAGLGRDQQMAIAKLQAQQQTLQQQHELAMRSGDREAAAKLAQQGFENQQKLAGINNQSQEKIAGLGILRSGIDPQTGLPIQVPLHGQDALAATQQAEQMNWGAMSPQEIANATAHLPPETQKRIAAMARDQQGQRFKREALGAVNGGLYPSNPMMGSFMRWAQGL